ncbi:hypothetical protein FHEFKHOI_00204 [Candidatus Methanoperedenaceae archaeon GB50]|nr:hypothetical protein FHEFKHOI_00204 [Candidatus Methanoperedenaceae archaeon GB50]CAD7774458.1 MAG: hypothetical protein KBONHNOK_00715 [Candidatus Methanoperedenaceae archaeon GB50]
MKRNNSILFAITALITLIAMAGSASAAEPVMGQVNSTTIDNTHIVTLYLDVNPSLTLNTTTIDGSSLTPPLDYYMFGDITPLLTAAGIGWGQPYNATIEMRCGYGSNQYRNTTPTTAHVSGVNEGNTDFATRMELEQCPTETHPDLVVSNIYPQYIFSDLTNVLSVNVTNQGNASAVSCKVSLTITHTGGPTVLTGTVPALGAGSSAVVEVGNWKPTVLENISMTAFADCDNDEPTEWDEGNNNLTEYRTTTGDCAVDDMLPDTCYGYRGDNPMTTVYEGTGGVIYSVGDYKYKNNTVNFNIGPSGDENQADGSTADVPDGATVKNATLYVYYCWRKSVTGPNPGADPRPDFEMSINGNQLTTNEYYTDIKGFAGSEYQYGTLVYDVTAYVTGDGTYQAVRSNYTYGKGYVSGMALLIIYDDGSGDTYRIAHGYDRLATFYKTQYKVLPEDATTTATLTDVDPNQIATANLFTVTVDAVPPGSESEQFNLRPWEVGAWDCVAGVPSCGYNYPLGINRGAVDKSDITASGTDEVVKFQERTNNGFGALFACLQAKGGAPEVVVDAPDTCVSGTFTVDIDVETNGNEIYAVQYDLSFDPDVIRILDQHQGTFLSENGTVDTMVVINEFDNVAGTASYSETRRDTLTGTSTPGPLASITFTTVGDPLDCSNITLSGVVVSDAGAQEISAVIENDSVCICEPNIGPTAVAKSDHKYNNVGSVFTCEATLNGSESYDPDGVIVQWSWACGDGGYESGEIAQHIYNTYQWNGSTYTPFTATLTVTDDDSATDDDDCEVIVYIAGDANGDGTVNILDAAMIGLRWMKTCNDYPGVCWGAEEMADRADLNNDCEVNILDAVIVGTQWGNNA